MRKHKKKLNFVDDVKVAQPIRVSRTSQIDLLNGEGIGEDMGIVQESLNAIGVFNPTGFNAPAALPSPGTSGSLTIMPSTPTTPPLVPSAPPVAPISPLPSGTLQPPTGTPTTSSPVGTTFQAPTNILGPTVNAGTDQTIQLPTTTATLQGTVSGPGGHTNTWSFVSGPQGVSPSISNPNNTQTDVNGLTIPGDYTFKLYSIMDTITGAPQKPNQFNNASDTVVITVNAAPASTTTTTPQPAPPASNSTIDGWDCATLNQYLNVYNQILSDPTLTQDTRNQYENALLYINDSIKARCTPSTTPNLSTSTSTAPPLPSNSDIDAMTCDQLNALKASLVTNADGYRTDPTTLQNYINTSNYVDLQFTQKCKNLTPTAPTVEIYAPGTTPYSTGVKTTSVSGMSGGGAGGAGGGGGSSSKAYSSPTQQNYKTWWWIGLIVVAGALILFKPGTKIGTVPSNS